MILGISGSPRPNGITANAVKYMLSKCEGETKFISLAGKHISGCISCLGCTKDNHCVVEDDFLEIAELMVKADAIVLGIPNYYDVPNALSHSLLERCFCFRHQGAFLLKDKPAVIFSTGYATDEENSQVLKIVDHFLVMNKMKVISKFLVGAFSQCYTCKYGRTCEDGNVVKNNGIVSQITPAMLPPKFNKQIDSMAKCEKAVYLLNDILKP
ncbi:flavodoxin family protein [Ancylomarina sp. 16SWW S1-10-2]|uniref:flavodoxin family protein n=1 Tax=Ancylomarina sp. 16SWW S1-10-2 TaxID=2499681 RepID=UPI0012AE3975|nr:flavodoxin family protein [Ancylomarina sp. 16SWW S1-10-2]MRT92631.1 flavodoxin family protein [Ancylomarina sp. 16SWW S1-10-2]